MHNKQIRTRGVVCGNNVMWKVEIFTEIRA